MCREWSLESDNVSPYLRKGAEAIIEECLLCEHNFHPRTLHKVRRICLEELILVQADYVWDGVDQAISQVFLKLFSRKDDSRSNLLEYCPDTFFDLEQMYLLFAETCSISLSSESAAAADEGGQKKGIDLMNCLIDGFSKLGSLLGDTLRAMHCDIAISKPTPSTPTLTRESSTTPSYSFPSTPTSTSTSNASSHPHESAAVTPMQPPRLQTSRSTRVVEMEYIDALIDTISLLNDVVRNVFKDNPKFVQAALKASKTIVNGHPDLAQIIQLFINYCESYLQVLSLSPLVFLIDWFRLSGGKLCSG
jgi:hypothetical protein